MEKDDLARGFADPALLDQALTHCSYSRQHPQSTDNERLEFFGDAVLKLVVSEYLYQKFPQHAEGGLSQIRARIISDQTLSELAKVIDLGHMIQMAESEKKLGGGQKRSILSGAFEAVLGAIYLDQGLQSARNFVIPLIDGHLSELMQDTTITDHKSRLQETLQKSGFPLPDYQLVREEGPQHNRLFYIQVTFLWRGRAIQATGKGLSKKLAEQAAAKDALGALL